METHSIEEPAVQPANHGEHFSLVHVPQATAAATPLVGQQRTMQSAWILLLSSFGIFCLLLLASFYGVWHYRTYAMDQEQALLIARAPLEWITWQRESRAIPERAQEQQTFTAGQRVAIARSAGYGQAATVRLFDNSTLDMWAGADLLLKELHTSRWNNREQRVVIEQQSGYIRYDLRNNQQYEHINFFVDVGDVRIALSPGGSYSIEVFSPERRVMLSADAANPPVQVDIAARSGTAEVWSQHHNEVIQEGQRVLIDPAGVPSEPMPALWQLVRDGDFSAYTQEQYNHTAVPEAEQPALVRANTWQVFSRPPDATGQGFFNISHNCEPPRISNYCEPEDRTHIAWFLRSGGQTRPAVTGIRQVLGTEQRGVDISEYRSLQFSVWVRVLYQSVDMAGVEGTECPVMISFKTKKDQPTDEEEERRICFYASNDPTQEPEHAPNTHYYRVTPFRWHRLTIDLRNENWLPDARYMRSIEIYANGRDYSSRVAEVSLLGSHYPPDHP
jgi:hypothetical protein